MADVFLITDTDIKKYSPLSGNIDIDKFRYLILEVQEFVIQKILGTKLFEKIKTDYAAETITGAYATIHTKYIKPILIHEVAAEFVEMSAVLIDNGGIYRSEPENSRAASMSEVSQQAAKLRNKAQVHIERLQRYLSDQGSTIEEYTYNQDNNYDIDPDKSVNTAYGLRLSILRKTTGGSRAERALWNDIWHDEGA